MNTSQDILGATLSRLLDTYNEHSLLARIEMWIEEGRDVGSVSDCFVMAREIVASAIPYAAVTRLAQPIAQTLHLHGFEQFQRVLEYEIDSSGENARWRLSQAGSALTGSAAHYQLIDPDGTNMSGILYSPRPDATPQDFMAWKDVVFFPETEAEIKPMGRVQFFRTPPKISKPMSGMRISMEWPGKPPWEE